MNGLFKEYLELKASYDDAVIMYQVGEFFEILNDDARTVAAVLDLTLTKRGSVHMCGIPKKHVERYAAKLAHASFKVVLYSQIGEDKVERAVTRIFTPGTINESEYLSDCGSRYLMCVGDGVVAWADISLGAIFYDSDNDLIDSISVMEPAEIISISSAIVLPNIRVTMLAAKNYSEVCLGYFNNNLDMTPNELEACGAIIDYIAFVNCSDKCHLYIATPIKLSIRPMMIDANIIDKLEILKPQNKNGISLYDLFSRQMKTPMGKRLFRKMLLNPLNAIVTINKRLDLVEFFYKNNSEIFNPMRDVERAIVRIAGNKGGIADLIIVKEAMYVMANMPDISSILDTSCMSFVAQISRLLENISADGEILSSSNAALADMRELAKDAEKLIQQMAARLRGFYGAKSLQIIKNNVVGYCIEVASRDVAKIIDEGLILRQTLTACVRYSSFDLMELESKIINVHDNIARIESKIIGDTLREVIIFTQPILQCANLIAKVDVASAIAKISSLYGYCRPFFCDNGLTINAGRHPLLLHVIGDDCVSNDIDMNNEIMVITAPNMSGKSVFLKQNALIVYMAHIGMFVPASYVSMKLVDRIFCRIGEGENMQTGRSTFMQEMIDLANLVNNATSSSLAIIDELGRGTSTKEGVAIAYSVIEYLYKVVGCNTIVATHYHELVSMLGNINSILWRTFDCCVDNNRSMRFSRKLRVGTTDNSYAVMVAELAGMREDFVERIHEVMCRNS